ncbi:MAG: branched-chain amino acid ABC transporter permease, partial [Deltaproteobacteria bacterium]|nr:branched-chain amino acid ABC transporter permease [Deltaproteobacteria bacterium]
VHPFIGLSYGPLTFMICVLGGLGNLVGGFFASFLISQIISIGSFYVSTELSYVIAFVLFILVMFIRPEGLFKRRA